MADRILTWYLETLSDNAFSDGPVFIMDRDYEPRVVRIHTKRAPGGANLEIDIRDDGTSIFTAPLPTLNVDTTSEDVMQDFLPITINIEKYSLVTLHMTASGAAGITVQLELDTTQDIEVAEADT